MEEKRQFPVKWLRLLFYLELASLVLSVLGYLPIKNGWISWPSRVLTAGVIYCMFCMGVFYSRYKTAAIFRTVQFAFSLISAIATIVLTRYAAATGNTAILQTFNSISLLIGSVALVLSWIGTYQFYHANADLVAEKSPELEKKWRNFFWVSLGIGLAVSAGSYLLAFAMEALNADYRGAMVTGTLFTIPSKIISLICVIYLYRTVGILEKE